MEKTISGTIEIEAIKRCYVIGAVIKTECPVCGSGLETDLGDNYLCYPEICEAITIGFYCKKCEDNGVDFPEYEINAKVVSAVMTVEYDLSSIKQS